MGFAKLGVNIDHVATLRNARGGTHPSLLEFSQLVFFAGADTVILHLREDRRHVHETDLEAIALLAKQAGKPFCMEFGVFESTLEIVEAIKPSHISLTPTLGGFKFLEDAEIMQVQKIVTRLRKLPNAPILSLFVDFDLEAITKALTYSPYAIELNMLEVLQSLEDQQFHEVVLPKLIQIKNLIQESGVELHAAYGLTEKAVLELDRYKIFDQFNLGHFIVSQSLFEGASQVVSRIVNKLKGGSK